MKAKWSRSWKSSKQPRKQRKYRYNAPLHTRHKLIAARLSKELTKKYKRRSFPLRKGDKVKIVRGQFKGVIGEIDRIDLKKYKVYVRGAEIKKKDGTKVLYPISSSNLIILSMSLEDKRRVKALERKWQESSISAG